MGQADIPTHAFIPPIPASNTHSLSIETKHKFQVQTAPSLLPEPMQTSFLGLSSQRLTSLQICIALACNVPKEWLLAGVFAS